jgi:hypothetical protein
VGVGRGICGEVQLQLGLESGVVVDGFEKVVKASYDRLGRGVEKNKFGDVDLIVGKVGCGLGSRMGGQAEL